MNTKWTFNVPDDVILQSYLQMIYMHWTVPKNSVKITPTNISSTIYAKITVIKLLEWLFSDYLITSFTVKSTIHFLQTTTIIYNFVITVSCIMPLKCLKIHRIDLMQDLLNVFKIWENTRSLMRDLKIHIIWHKALIIFILIDVFAFSLPWF